MLNKWKKKEMELLRDQALALMTLWGVADKTPEGVTDYTYSAIGCPDFAYDAVKASGFNVRHCLTVITDDKARPVAGHTLVAAFLAGTCDCPKCEGDGMVRVPRGEDSDFFDHKECPLCERQKTISWGRKVRVLVYAMDTCQDCEDLHSKCECEKVTCAACDKVTSNWVCDGRGPDYLCRDGCQREFY